MSILVTTPPYEPHINHVVRLVVCRPDGSVLLLQRSEHDYFGGSWELPGGGADGEDHGTALARELLEETGMHLLSVEELLHEEHFEVPAAGPRAFTEYTYLCRAEGEPVLSEEHDGLRWHDPVLPFHEQLSPTAAIAILRLAERNRAYGA